VSKEAILLNNYTNAVEPERQEAQIKEWREKGVADYCIPLIVPRSMVVNVMHEKTKEMKQPGYTARHFHPIRPDRDIIVVVLPELVPKLHESSESMLDQLASDDFAIRLGAVEAFAQDAASGDENATHLVMGMLHDPDHNVRAAAVWATACATLLSINEASSKIASLVDDPVKEVQCQVQEAFKFLDLAVGESSREGAKPSSTSQPLFRSTPRHVSIAGVSPVSNTKAMGANDGGLPNEPQTPQTPERLPLFPWDVQVFREEDSKESLRGKKGAHSQTGHTAWVMHHRDVLWEKVQDAIERRCDELSLDREKPDHMTKVEYYLKTCMKQGELIYIQRDWDRQNGYSIGEESTCVEPEDLTKFPGYSVFFPITRDTWIHMFAKWFVGAGLKFVFMISSLTLCYELIQKNVEGYKKNPVLSNVTLAVLAFSFTLESVRTMIQTYQFHKKTILDAAELNCVTAMLDFGGYFVLRFFEVPHHIGNAAEDMNRMNLLRNNADTLGLPPIRFCLSKAQYHYNNVSGHRHSASNLISRNVIATILKLILFYQVKADGFSPALILSILLAVAGFLKATYSSYRYAAIVTGFYNELQNDIEYIGHNAGNDCDRRWFDLTGIQKYLPLKSITNPERACFPEGSRFAWLKPCVLPCMVAISKHYSASYVRHELSEHLLLEKEK